MSTASFHNALATIVQAYGVALQEMQTTMTRNAAEHDRMLQAVATLTTDLAAARAEVRKSENARAISLETFEILVPWLKARVALSPTDVSLVNVCDAVQAALATLREVVPATDPRGSVGSESEPR